ncbi:hypothetical protein BD626DRAFT_634233 [Schizophyllum amplum]|uniref:C2H2-type domain-containing protein n=1 Tax=Schizophyllum amplum TaxID=97359 RepID=A0A550C050_9AGAR|nr:hypothetical protein BD626DRAFT_634233 [Auriculariopsis ampla]
MPAIDYMTSSAPLLTPFVDAPAAHTILTTPPMHTTLRISLSSSPATSSAVGSCSTSIPSSPCVNVTHGGTDGFRQEIGSSAQTAASFLRRRPGSKPNPDYRCRRCGKTFTRSINFQDHCLRHENHKRFSCIEPSCISRFNTASDRDSHSKRVHGISRRRVFS